MILKNVVYIFEYTYILYLVQWNDSFTDADNNQWSNTIACGHRTE